MEKHVQGLLIVLAILSLLVGFAVGNVVGPKTEIVKEIPVEKVVTQEVVKEVPVVKEVIKEVPVTKEITSDELLQKAISTFKEEKLDDLQKKKNEEYDSDQIEVNKVYDQYTINFDKDKQEVEFKIKLKYLDEDVGDKCYATYNVEVIFEEDEEPIVNLQ